MRVDFSTLAVRPTTPALDDGLTRSLTFQTAPPAAHREVGAIPANFGQAGRGWVLFAVAEAEKKIAIPNALPRVGEQVAG